MDISGEFVSLATGHKFTTQGNGLRDVCLLLENLLEMWPWACQCRG